MNLKFGGVYALGLLTYHAVIFIVTFKVSYLLALLI